MKKDDEMTHSFENPSDSHTSPPIGLLFLFFLILRNTKFFFFCHPSTNIIGLYGIGSVGKITILQKKKKKKINNEYFGIEKKYHLKKIIKKLIMSILEKKNDFDILEKDPIFYLVMCIVA